MKSALGRFLVAIVACGTVVGSTLRPIPASATFETCVKFFTSVVCSGYMYVVIDGLSPGPLQAIDEGVLAAIIEECNNRGLTAQECANVIKSYLHDLNIFVCRISINDQPLAFCST